MRLRDSYDIPEEVARGPHSPAFGDFLWNWFGDTRRLTRGELDLTFLDDLTPDELALAREMVRRNLKVRHTHIIEGLSALHDVDAAPLLRKMLVDETSVSRQLTIAGVLWKLNRDPIFVDLLNSIKAHGDALIIRAHLYQVFWLDDERAIDYLIDLLDKRDVNRARAIWHLLRRIPVLSIFAGVYFRTVEGYIVTAGASALGLLKELESEDRMLARDNSHLPSYYRAMRDNPDFRESMTAALHRRNAGIKNGR